MMITNLSDLSDWLRVVLPEHSIGEDMDGQLIIYTNLRVVGNIVFPFEDGEPAH
jgi:hypothetical protein